MAIGVGERIKNLRIKKGLTQFELASKLSVSADLVSKWELEKRFPDYEMLADLSDIFDIDSEMFLGADSMIFEELDSCIPPGMELRTIRQYLAEYISTLSEKDRITFELRYIKFSDTKTIARKLGKSDGSIRNKLVDLRKKLKAYLERYGR